MIELGLADVGTYLVERVVQQTSLLADVAADQVTVRPLLDRKRPRVRGRDWGRFQA